MSENDSSLKRSFNINRKTIAMFVIPLILLGSLFVFAGFEGFSGTTDIEVADLDGNTISTADYSGKIQFIEFFATWCTSCKQITQAIASYHQKYQFSDVIFWSISIDTPHDQPNIIQNYINDNNLSSYIDQGTWNFGRDLKDYHEILDVTGVPHTFLMAPNGSFVKNYIGVLNIDDIEDWINSLR
ncbi:MAG: Thiol-disulfide oxidoreductase ResA [Candidatus Heimdallarchaeota archaeon LC_3]|nr:MAG: Thiol-disulfide oxidoreductase ResA [Candidatus Heimdallarchaeota archaeon LC_3]